MKRNSIFVNSILLFLSVALFVLSEPSFIFKEGLSFCAFIAYIPYFLLLENLSLKSSLLFGALYGFFSYLLMCHWLSSFGLAALFFVCFLFALYNSVTFFLISFIKTKLTGNFKEYFWIFRALLVLFVDFLRTQGIFAFSYGIIGYSQWKNPVLLGFASAFGVYGVSFVILLFNSLTERILRESELLSFKAKFRKTVRREICLLLLLVFAVISFWAGKCLFSSRKSGESLKIALIQNSSSASSRTISDFEKDAALLKTLTDQALFQNPETELVVWAETAIVPDILYNLENPGDKRRHELSKNLADYFKSKGCSFLIGNNHNDEAGTHNSALFFSSETGKIEIYDKNHLVPFTEYWPETLNFKIFDGLKKSLGCEFFSPGGQIKIFKIKKLSFASPICFEDSFPSLVKKMKRGGADFFVNISDDAWSEAEEARNIHLSMSVFRAAENSSPFIRSTIDGKTCVIDRNGKITKALESGIDGFLCAEIH